ncbi:MAG TPA: glycosyltransferase family 4 protein [Patescibacteria group bacterium]|nr:glycosyltransferase family 4 protein [Patescibacteria group bacterium]
MGKRTQKTTILIVTPYFLPNIGGVQMYVYHITKGLYEKYKWRIVIVTTNSERKKQRVEVKNGIKIYSLPYLFKFSNTPVNPFWFFSLKQIIASENPHIICAHAPVPFFADIAAFACGKRKFILTYHTGRMNRSDSSTKNIIAHVYENYFLPIMAKKSSLIIAVSTYVKETVFNKFAEKTIVITPGVDTNMFVPGSKREEGRIIFVGSLNKAETYKNLSTLLNAIYMIKQRKKYMKLIVVGQGDNINTYKKLCKQLHIEDTVTFTGGLYGNDLIREYQRASLLVHPTLFESFALVLLEAMACKLPIVTTRVGGIPEVIDEGKSGLMVSPVTSRNLAKAILYMFDNPTHSSAMANRGYKMAQTLFTWNVQVNRTKDAIERLIQ